ncbi:MAG: nucleotidyltransferase domain-containing protein [Halobacteriota archaeon]
MFEVSEARKRVLEKLAEGDWTPTELAEELGIKTQTAYNHLRHLEEIGVLEKRKVEAKTRPMTRYSIDEGFIQYVAVLPGVFAIRTLRLNRNKKALFRIWSIPQPEFHSHLEEVWHELEKEDGILAVGVYGSVARGEADQDSDIDLLIITEKGREELEEKYGSRIVEGEKDNKLIMSQVYTLKEYRDSLVHQSDFLARVEDEVVPVFDPEGLLWRRGESRQKHISRRLSSPSGQR